VLRGGNLDNTVVFVLGSRYGSVRIGNLIHRRSDRGGDILIDLSRSPCSDGITLDHINIVIEATCISS